MAFVAAAGVLGAGQAAGAQAPESDAGQRMGRSVLALPGWSGGAIGVTLREVQPADVERAGLAAARGAVVEAVRSEGPAAHAGLQAGDVIVEYDGEAVRSARHLARLVQETPPGREVPLAVVRAGVHLDMTIAPGSPGVLAPLEQLGRLGEVVSSLHEFQFDVRLRPGRLGVVVQELSPQLAEYFGVREGVLVTSVEPDSAAAKAGVRAGDVITAVNDEPVARTRDLRRRLLQIETGDAFRLAIVRDRQELSLSGSLEEPGPGQPFRYRLPA